MTKPVVFMFSGQGSQYYHMGKELYEKNEPFRKWMNELDGIASGVFGKSIVEIIYDEAKNKSEAFIQTLDTSPAIIMVEYALAKVLIEAGIKPDYLLGASLGEVTASLLAGVFNLRDLFDELFKQLELFEKNCLKGKMIGIIDSPELFEKTPALNENSEIAAYNFDSHFVVSCEQNHVKRIEAYLEKEGIQYQTLPVSLGFHSSMLDTVEHLFKDSIKNSLYKHPKIPLVSCTYAKEMSSFDKNSFWDIFRQPIQFQKTIQALEKKNDHVYVDLGPSGTLANFVKYNLKKDSMSEVFSILTPFGQDLKNLDKIKAYFSSHYLQEKKMMKTYVFPGQGSQIKGMGGALFDEFKELTEKADEILGYSIKKLCLEDPDRQLHQTQYTQPALFVVNALSYYKKVKETKETPDFVAGHSLGEYNALLVAGGFDFETGLKLVKKRGELMSQASGGAMAAVLGLTEEKTREILERNDLLEIDIANLNAPTQIVISGLKDDINKAQPFFDNAGATYIPLNVSAAFHSRQMQKAKEEFETYVNGFEFSELAIPVISNVEARPYKHDKIAANLADQLRSSVKWSGSVQYLISQGEMEFEELGPGDVLTKLIERIKSEATSTIEKEENTDATLNTESNVGFKNSSDKEDEESKTGLFQNEESVSLGEDVLEKRKYEDESDDKAAGRAAYKREIEDVHKKIADWNKTYPCGTKVTCESYDEELITRTEAVLLFGHRAAIYMEGYNGYFALDEITPV